VPKDGDRDIKDFLDVYPNSVSDIMTLGEVKTYTINGLDYQTELVSIFNDKYVQFSVNGQTTTELEKSDTFKLSDGSALRIREISNMGGETQVAFYLGK